jgi:hypothetical protein
MGHRTGGVQAGKQKRDLDFLLKASTTTVFSRA